MEGNIDVRGLLNLYDSVLVGYKQTRICMNIEGDCRDEELDDLFAFARNHSPACNTVCRPVPVVLEKVDEQSRRCVEEETILPSANEHIQLD